jgi:PKD repeat protein
VLTYLDCRSNQLTNLDVSGNTALTILKCYFNQLTSLDVSANTTLTYLDCNSNQLGALDIKANEALKSLNCASNQLTSLDVRNGHNTQITEFDATNNPSLNCISADDANYSTENWTNVDAHTSFNGDCGFIADFVADETSGPLPLEVQFTDRSDNTATSWQWDFGDGNTSEEQSPSHTYTNVGNHTVSLSISNGSSSNIESKIGFIEVLAVTALKVEDQGPLLYPNPATNILVLQFESGMRSIRMLNLNGQTVYEKHGIDKLAGRLEIDTSTYPPGEYIIRFEGKGKTTARKVLISR